MILSELTAAYLEPHRHYHTLSHIVYMLEKVGQWGWELTDGLCEVIWFHDYVYVIGEKDNEELSARSLEDWYFDKYRMEGWFNEEQDDRYDMVDVKKAFPELKDLRSAIIATRDHIPLSALFPATFNPKKGIYPLDVAAQLVDLDLSILAGTQDEYDRYLDGVKKEFRQVFTEEQWTEGRRKWIKNMLDRPHIFYTEKGKQLCEEFARMNLHNELKLYRESQND